MKASVDGEKHYGDIPLPVVSTSTPRHRPRRSLLVVIGGFFLFLTCRSWSSHQPHHVHKNPAYLIEAEHGAVATENKRCSDIGVDILKAGGNAVDASISAILCVGIVNSFSSGLGGGGFLTVRLPPTHPNGSSEVYNVDFRETAPAASYPEMYPPGTNTSRFGGLSIAVPGEIRGLEEAHKRWGSLPWKEVLQPAIELAAGWEVDRELGIRIPWLKDLMLNNPEFRSIFAPNGRMLKEGEPIKRTNYSRTLAKIAEEGADAFYTGDIADSIIRKVTATGGIMTHDDLANYQVHVERALEGSYRGRKIYTTHAPTSGGVLIHMLNLMEKFDMSEMNALNVHRMVEAMRFGFAARTQICDPEYQNNTLKINEIPTKDFADLIYPNITEETHAPEYYNPEYDIKTDHGTNHVSVLDSTGMAVSVTSTVNLLWGSQVMDSETGIVFNDEMDDFAMPGTPNGFGLWPSPYNYPEPGKRSLSSTAASIMENADGSLYLVIGGSGGSRIFPSIFQVIMNLEWGMDMSQAIEYGRMHDQLYPLYMDVDDTYPKHFIDDLISRGHNVTVEPFQRVAAVIQGIIVQDGKIFAASDSRKNGIAAGY